MIATVRSGGAAPNNWNSTGWEISTTNLLGGNSKLANCINTTNHAGGGGGGTSYTESFTVTAPMAPGSYFFVVALDADDGTGATACGDGANQARQQMAVVVFNVSATLNGASSVTVAPGATVSAAVTLAVTSPINNWQSTGWATGTTEPAFETQLTNCVDTTNVAANTTATRTFNITAPATAGTYSVYFALDENDGTGGNACGSGSNNVRFTMSAALTVVAGPTKLAFTSSEFNGAYGQCLGPITVQTQNASSVATNVTSTTAVSVATDATGGFFSDNACATSVTNVVIATGNNMATFYYRAGAVGDGTHQLTASATGLTSASQTQTIQPRDLTIAAANKTKTYGQVVTFDETTPSTDFTVTGLVNADTVASITLTSAGAAATAQVSGSPFAIVASAAAGTGLGNYTIDYDDGSLTVGRKDLTIAAANKTKTYGQVVTFDETTPSTDFTVTGLVNADTVASITLTSAGASRDRAGVRLALRDRCQRGRRHRSRQLHDRLRRRLADRRRART